MCKENQPKNVRPELLTLAEAAGLLGISPQTLLRHARAGIVPKPLRRPGGRFCFPRDLFLQWMAAQPWEGKAPEPPP
jgi:excisionase family DNA binding protein